MNRPFWQAAETDPQSPAAQLHFAPKMNAALKIVFSRTLPDNPGWNARVIRDHLVDEVAALKRQPGKPMVMFGSAQLMQAFMRHDLIDEYRFMINPLLLGGGAHLFRGDHPRYPLRLVETRPLETGVLVLRYERVR